MKFGNAEIIQVFYQMIKKAFWINGIKISADTVEVRIPSEINGIKVTKIGAYDFNADYCSIFERFPYEEDKMSAPAYRDGRNITKIVVSEGVKVIVKIHLHT